MSTSVTVLPLRQSHAAPPPARGPRSPAGPAAGGAEMCMRRRVAPVACARPVVPAAPAPGRQCSFVQRSCGLHDASSHENDGSKYLKHDQIVAVHDAAVTVPQLSDTVLWRNLQLADYPHKTLWPTISAAFSDKLTMSESN